jgi:hypothetical protein
MSYESLNDKEILEYQNRVMKEQDLHLDLIEKSVNNLKLSSQTISQEIAIQNRLLDDMTVQVDQNISRTRTVTNRIKNLMTVSGNCKLYFYIIFGLAILILLLLKLG